MAIALVISAVLAAEPSCTKDADCTVTSWVCCQCPKQRAASLAQLKQEEDKCARVRCVAPACHEEFPRPDPAAVAVCKAGQCVLGKPPDAAPGAECRVASDCEVTWTASKSDCGACACCADTPVATKRPVAPPLKRLAKCPKCPAPPHAEAECLEGKCSVAPRAMPK